jgi:DnaJ-class molecular chaperone
MFRDATGHNAAGRKRGRGRAAPPPAGEDIEHEAEIDLLDTLRGATLSLEIDHGPSGRERVDVKIPAGVREGQRVRLAGLGGRGPGGAGDLYVRVKVRAHPLLQRRGDDLVFEVPVTIGEAVAGARIAVPSPWGGTIELSVPPGTSSGQMLRVRGLGLPVSRAGAAEKGDLFVRVLVRVPKGASPAALEAARTLDGLYEGDVRKDLRL